MCIFRRKDFADVVHCVYSENKHVYCVHSNMNDSVGVTKFYCVHSDTKDSAGVIHWKEFNSSIIIFLYV